MKSSDAILRNMTRAGGLLAVFAIVASGLVAMTFAMTKERIAENERAAVLRSLHEIVPPEWHDNDIFKDAIQITDAELLGTPHPVTVFRARQQGEPTAAILSVIAPDGYGGPIKMLVGIRVDGSVAGVRVVSHRETPGLGDGIEIERSDWITAFAGKSLTEPGEKQWRVRRDGGVFDQFTGATITPRAVVKATRNALVYFRKHRDEIFAEPAPGETTPEERPDE